MKSVNKNYFKKTKKIKIYAIILLAFIFVNVALIINTNYSKEEDTKAFISKGDLLYNARHKTNNKYIPNEKAVKYSMALYQKAFGNDPRNPKDEEACWKYLRSAYFYGSFIKEGDESKKFLLSKYTEYAIPFMKAYPKSPEIHYYAVVLLGRYAEVFGIVEAAKTDIPNKIRRYLGVTITYNPRFEEGGAYRALGRIHFVVPAYYVKWKNIKKAKEYYEEAIRMSNKGSAFWKLGYIWLAELYFRCYSDLGISANEGKEKAISIMNEVKKYGIDTSFYTEEMHFKKTYLTNFLKELGFSEK